MKIFSPSRKKRPFSSVARVTMPPRSEPACGSVHAALELSRHEARQVTLAELFAPVLLDVLRHPGLQPDDRHEARVGARDHLEVGAVDEHRQAVAAVLGAERQAEEAGAAQLL